MKHIITIVSLAALAGCVQPGTAESKAPASCSNADLAKLAASTNRVRDVVEKRVAVGATICDVIAAWGAPDGVSERAGYRGEIDTTYIYRATRTNTGAVVRFTDGRVVSIYGAEKEQ